MYIVVVEPPLSPTFDVFPPRLVITELPLSVQVWNAKLPGNSLHQPREKPFTLRTAFDVATLLSHIRTEPASLVVIDLGTPRIDPAQLVSELRLSGGEGLRILAFGPHVHEQKLAAARAAGCDEVLTRGQFHASLDRIFSGLT